MDSSLVSISKKRVGSENVSFWRRPAGSQAGKRAGGRVCFWFFRDFMTTSRGGGGGEHAPLLQLDPISSVDWMDVCACTGCRPHYDSERTGASGKRDWRC